MKTKNKFLRIILILITCCFTTICFSQNDQELKEQVKEEVRVSYMNYLEEQGYKPEVDEDGDVTFKFEGKRYYLFVKTNRVFTLVRFLSDDDSCSGRSQKAISKTSGRYLNISIHALLSCKSISFSSRSFLKEKDDWKDFFTVSLNSVKNSIESAKDFYVENK